jgi:hypothetical protein
VESGDAVYFDASTPHSYRCAGKTPAIALIVTMHQIPIAQPAVNLRPLGAPMSARAQNGGLHGTVETIPLRAANDLPIARKA